MFPFALLAIFLLDINAFSISGTLENIKMFPTMWKQIGYYLVFTIALEFVLRILHGFFGLFKKNKVEKEEEQEKSE